ncbi:citrate synthase [Cupriavidus necator N-1]|jgi:citrate synthase|uniref:citrate synthase (unknown stereospecificity) n=1 Tax=Cupriavidus necator (strain ATCC 43291 / DSM 13513 / CCUG 52238 / LMG 8453 / N-1) TaxID=1042878 RepID=F8GT12_CUPNN|nr:MULTISPECIES: citryl-CoA lyase [Cupriavidus]AEI81139.1 citrate synthase [Cupriavidus necator N-1]KAI3600285.1 Citrate synthase (si) [Cupriavidus necator H850]MDX6009241.1 citryl-CoA lyase [Cupriavidus necator]QUN25778.1 citryl-CoA lyase [Cupriavidus sp. KK10]
MSGIDTSSHPGHTRDDAMDPGQRLSQDWWRTGIIDMRPGEIRYRGYPIEQLIGRVSFAQMIWLMLRGELPGPGQGELLDAALMAAVDHGPQAPSIAIARMAATCGVGLNNAMASAVNVLGDVHGGAGEQAVALYQDVAQRLDASSAMDDAVAAALQHYRDLHGKFIAGFGHRFHPVDPRAPRLLALVDQAAANGVVSGRYAGIARAVEAALGAGRGKPIPMNIDGATAVIYAELGFAAPLARGLFCLSRSVGILAHAWEQTCEGGRNKGPMPRQFLWTYDGAPQRDVPEPGRQA